MNTTNQLAINAITVAASDQLVADAAWVSTGIGSSDPERVSGLIDFLIRNRHGSPFEHGTFTFRVHAPLFVAQQWMRHRAGHSYNQESGRYRELENEFYLPALGGWREQTGKPGAYEYGMYTGDGVEAQTVTEDAYRAAWDAYQALLCSGVAREQARIVLPLGLFTTFYWTCNPRSLMHFLGLRAAEDAQHEISVLATDAEAVFCETMPITWKAWDGNGRVAP